MAKNLSHQYYNPQRVGSYSGAHGLLKGLKKRNKRVNDGEVREWLSQQDTYTLHKTPRRKFTRRKTIVSGPDQQWQMDLIDLSSLKKHNKGKTFVLTVIDVFSKVAYAVPLLNKTSAHVIKGLKSVFSKAPKNPRALQSDKGSEFTNSKVRSFLKDKGVRHFVSENDDIKCAVVERFNRTLKERLWRYFTKQETLHYLKVLPMLIGSYNRTPHRSIGMAPVEVNRENQETVWRRLYGPRSASELSQKQNRFKAGDRVRISQTRRQFKKGYLPSWTTEEFVVTRALQTTPPTYRLKDEAGEAISGSFYEAELQHVTAVRDKIYNIERVLDKKGDQLLVRWEGYPPSFDSWIQSKALVNKNKKKKKKHKKKST